MQRPKELFINSVGQIRIDGSTIVPTAVFYKGNRCYIGGSALEMSESYADIKEDFKVELGKADPTRLAQRISNSGQVGRSVLGIAKDFIDRLLENAISSLEMRGVQKPTKLLIAEPLNLEKSIDMDYDDWLKNYRGSLRKIISNQFLEVDFLPEPFAVFQYYRYGIKHPLVAEKQKHIALVLDFGGGTFDASVIETTGAGDISRGGKNSRPLAARSVAIGGFHINRVVADRLLEKILDKNTDRDSLRAARRHFTQLKNADSVELSTYSKSISSFVSNYKRLLASVEQAKIAICSALTNWRLDADLSAAPACQVQVPQRPLEGDSRVVPMRLEAGEFREIFEKEIWTRHLKNVIIESLKRSKQDLGGRSISIALLSGGSSNIRWIKNLIERDLRLELQNADILELNENFQEIVAKGLAVECARRYFTEGAGDFRAVTYNRLCLGLDPNNSGLEFKRYRSENPVLVDLEHDIGVLLPSSTSLRGLVGEPLRWKVRLDRAPTQTLDYYFMRSSFDPNDIPSRQNIDSRVSTPKNTNFGSGIGIELTVREDGTADPIFIYGQLGTKNEIRVAGRPFALDMTFAPQEVAGESYLGLDFGTSTSSVCYVNGEDIRVYNSRSRDANWLGLNKLVDFLPYPISFPLAHFIGKTSEKDLEFWGREAVEAMLSVAAYVALAEHVSLGRPVAGLMKNFQNRSAGPLMHLLREISKASAKDFSFAQEVPNIVIGEDADEINESVVQIAQAKHGKSADGLNWVRLLEKIGNIVAKMMQQKLIGFFEDVSAKKFKKGIYSGRFRNMSGSKSPFIDIFEYEGSILHTEEVIFMIDLQKNKALKISPFLIRGLQTSSVRFLDPDLFFYDRRHQDGNFGFKAVQPQAEVVVAPGSDLEEIHSELDLFLTKERDVGPLVFDVNLKGRDHDEG